MKTAPFPISEAVMASWPPALLADRYTWTLSLLVLIQENPDTVWDFSLWHENGRPLPSVADIEDQLRTELGIMSRLLRASPPEHPMDT